MLKGMESVNFNCGTTSEKMEGNDYNFFEIACIIHKREQANVCF